jgi:hypothetical protein
MFEDGNSVQECLVFGQVRALRKTRVTEAAHMERFSGAAAASVAVPVVEALCCTNPCSISCCPSEPKRSSTLWRSCCLRGLIITDRMPFENMMTLRRGVDEPAQ